MLSLLSLPLEIIEEILLHLDPLDVARVSESCNYLRLLVYNAKDQSLWRELYLEQPLDDPRKCVSQEGVPIGDEIEWQRRLQRFIRARTVLYNPTISPLGERLRLLQFLLEMVTCVPPLSSPEDIDNVSRNLAWVAAALRYNDYSLLQDVSPSTNSEDATTQLCARLHTYFGITGKDALRASRVESRAFVYDMRKYRWESHYGPLDSLRCVNWVHVQALHHVLSMHLVDLKEDDNFDFAIFPMSIPFTQPVIPAGVDLDKEEDWAGVTGIWRVSFCFCDHSVLLRYNGSHVDDDGNLDSSIFAEPDFGEVFRSLDVNLRVLKTTPDPSHPNRPVIHFTGEMPESNSRMTGEVKMTPDDQVLWNFVSGEVGEAVWSSVGIHIGGPRALYGVLGTWTTVFHESDDPVGPFWLRRLQPATMDLPMNHVSLNASH
ncbi:hypothetical protein FPV67DRAFT_1577079 [Lyophyllum atratum]|nr:hypothetical protein FPV67DRAFT_1577079 [Lyophyllum atratum]